jgi:hypothetical protein
LGCLLLTACASGSLRLRERSITGLPESGPTFGGTLLDADGDGRLDLFLSRHTDTPEIYLNQGDFRFLLCTEDAFFPPLVDQHGSAACDFDADGDWDVYITVGAGKGQREGFNHLWSSEAPCSYLNHSEDAPFLSNRHGRGRGALWFDADADGALELLILNHDTAARLFSYGSDGWRNRSQSLPPYPPAPGADGARKSRNPPRDTLNAACAGDLDGDGAMEVFVGGSENMLLAVGGDRLLRDVSADWGLEVGGCGVVQPDFADLDGDGDLDLLVACRSGNLRVWLNEDHRLKPLESPGFDLEDRVVSLQTADLDNDGIQDLFLGLVTAIGLENVANRVALGRGDGTFALQANLRIAAVESPSTGVWAVDVDHDGDLDLISIQGAGSHDESRGTVVIHENQTKRRGITLELKPRSGPAHGLGARLSLRDSSIAMTRSVRSVANPFNSTILRPHFGVGEATGPFILEILWPGGARQEIELPVSSAAYRVTEGEDIPLRLSR